MLALSSPVPPPARFYYLAISSIVRRHLSTSRRASSSSSTRSDFTTQGFTGFYEPGGPTEGPLRNAHTPPRITPTLLKQHLDSFVVGQDRAKRTLATAVYNHYQRIAELQRRDEEEADVAAQEERRRMAAQPRHPVEGREHDLRDGIPVPALTRDWPGEDEFPGQPQTVVWNAETQQAMPIPPRQQQPQHPHSQSQSQSQSPPQSPPPLFDPTPLHVEKSNILLLGPSGVGKTLMAKTLARVLEVPFSMSDCTPFTQAGYIGEDAEVCVARLLAAANYDVARAERGIICLDEIDKIATARVSHGKDVSGEGVQQALLKIVEGTTVQVQAKTERSSGSTPRGGGSQPPYPPHHHTTHPTNSPLSGGTISGQQSSSPSGGQKGETYNVKTDNILFICAGAFNGLHKMILERISKGSIGFNAIVRAPATSSSVHETMIEGEDELFESHLPFYSPPPLPTDNGTNAKRKFNTLDLVEPQDLQTYGLIPELVGRLPISCALSSLSPQALVQVLTEPRNSLLKQYVHLFSLSQIDLHITTPALHHIALTASKMGTGARGLRTVLERLLADAMFDAPGSGTRFVLVTEDVAKRKFGPLCFERAQRRVFDRAVADEEDRWRRALEGEGQGDVGGGVGDAEVVRSFEEYREKVSAAGG